MHRLIELLIGKPRQLKLEMVILIMLYERV